jgi:hypothetical protein
MKVEFISSQIYHKYPFTIIQIAFISNIHADIIMIISLI